MYIILNKYKIYLQFSKYFLSCFYILQVLSKEVFRTLLTKSAKKQSKNGLEEPKNVPIIKNHKNGESNVDTA